MTDARLLEMRAGLVERGLLAEDFRLTAAGHAHVDALIEELKTAEPPCEPDRPRVFWNLNLRHRRRAA